MVLTARGSSSSQLPSGSSHLSDQSGQLSGGSSHLPSRSSQLSSGSSHPQSGSPTSQVPMNKILEVILQSLNLKEIENKQLKEKCCDLEQKLKAKIFAAASASKVLELKAKSPTPSTRSRHSMTRAKSLPVETKYPSVTSEHRKSSHPEIFLFPERSHLSKQQSANKFSSTISGGENDTENDGGLNLEDPGEFEGLEDSITEPAGVSQVYFNNVINELMKTKTTLHNLQMQQRGQHGTVSEMEMERMRNEIQQLRLTNQNLQRELTQKEEDLQKHTSGTKGLAKENSFELLNSDETADETSLTAEEASSNSAERLNEAEILKLKTENEELKREVHILGAEREQMVDIRKELDELNEAYDKLKGNVHMKILSTCLSEEKIRSKGFEDRLRIKIEESKKLSSQLGSLRQKYEELQQEKNALEKAMKLERTPSERYSATYGANRFNNPSGQATRFESTTTSYPPFTTKSTNSDAYNIRPDYLRQRLVAQNDLSQVDRKPSNIPMNDGHVLPFECPRCLQRFQVENSYLNHLEKCIE